MVKKRILVTGSEGFLGRHLINFLCKKNYIVFGSYKNKKNFLKYKNLKYLKCDISKINDVENIIKKTKPDLVFHLAAKSHPNFSFKKPIETIITNCLGTLHLFEKIKEFNLKSKVILACSSAQYGTRKISEIPVSEKITFQPDHIYGLSKYIQNLISFQYFKMFKVKAYNAIIFNTSGPGKNNDIFYDLSKQYLKQKNKKIITIKCGNLKNQRDFLHYDDTIKALYLISKKGRPGETYNISTPKMIEINQLIRYLKTRINKKIIIKIINKKIRKYDEKFTSGNNFKIKKLGWRPIKNYKNIIDEMCKLN